MKFETKYKGGGGSSDKYLKIEDGESFDGVFVGDPYSFKQHSKYPNPSVLCTEVGCPECLAGDTAKFRFRINFVVNENGVLKAKIFENNWYTWELLDKINKKYGLDNYKVEVSRTGLKQMTRYNIMPLPDGKLTDKVKEQLAAVELHNIGPRKAVEEPQDDGPPPFDADDDIPF